MTPSTSNILPFPTRTPSSAPLPPVQDKHPVPAGDKLDADERANYVASIVRSTIGFAKRKGRRIGSLPPQLRGWLLGLCEQGDPTCLVVRDWLDGNPSFNSRSSQEGA
ncbi:hypothetical protein ACQKGC_19270 [Allorhizobium pseudoryzae]|uniref:hypothetical protein n=1 Tax=Allorhizobium pseudoryzae TaxID=379684 RepID=UPI003D082CDE